jgi:hypothetical protein
MHKQIFTKGNKLGELKLCLHKDLHRCKQFDEIAAWCNKSVLKILVKTGGFQITSTLQVCSRSESSRANHTRNMCNSEDSTT